MEEKAATNERLTTELSLLDSMYPEQITYNEKRRELTFTQSAGSKLQLRIPEGYPTGPLPEVLLATFGKEDLRNQIQKLEAECPPGEEILDSIIASFNDLTEENAVSKDSEANGDAEEFPLQDANATIVVWLHHLLNTNKRKLALSPASVEVSGISKPGYPGVLVYSGPATAVHEHVNELKQQNWQAFQVRLESDEKWVFKHGSGVVEVEAMKDVVAEVGEAKKVFLEAMRMK